MRNIYSKECDVQILLVLIFCYVWFRYNSIVPSSKTGQFKCYWICKSFVITLKLCFSFVSYYHQATILCTIRWVTKFKQFAKAFITQYGYNENTSKDGTGNHVTSKSRKRKMISSYMTSATQSRLDRALAKTPKSDANFEITCEHGCLCAGFKSKVCISVFAVTYFSFSGILFLFVYIA